MRRAALALLVVVALAMGCVGTYWFAEREVLPRLGPYIEAARAAVATPVGATLTPSASPTVTNTQTPQNTPTASATATPLPLPPTPTGTVPIRDSVLPWGLNYDPAEFSLREAVLASRVFNGDPVLGQCVTSARAYLEGHLKEGAPRWSLEPVEEVVAPGSSWSINKVSLATTSERAFQLTGAAGEEGWLYEVSAPAGTFISQLACRRDGRLYTYNADIARDGVAYLFVWREGRSRAFFMGACANFGVVEERLATPTAGPPPTALPSATPEKEVTPTPTRTGVTPTPSWTPPVPTGTRSPTPPAPTDTPVPPTGTPRPPTATPPPLPTPQPPTTVPTATAQPATRVPTATDIPPPPPTPVPETSTPVPPVVLTPTPNPTPTPPQP